MPQYVSEFQLSRMLGVSRHRGAAILQQAGIEPEGRVGVSKMIPITAESFANLEKRANADSSVFQRKVESLATDPAKQASFLLNNIIETSRLLRTLHEREKAATI